MAKYKLGQYTFDNEDDFNKAKEDYAFIKAVKAKYDINNARIREIVLTKFKPKSIIGKQFVEELKVMSDTADLMKDLNDGPDTPPPLPSDRNIPQTAKKQPKKGMSKSNRIKLIIAGAIVASGLLIAIVEIGKHIRNKMIDDAVKTYQTILAIDEAEKEWAEEHPSTSYSSDNTTTSGSDGSAYSYGNLVYKGDVFAYVLPANCSGEKLFNDGTIEISDFTITEVEETQFDYNIVKYSGNLKYLAEKPTSSVTLSFGFLDKYDEMLTEYNAGVVNVSNGKETLLRQGDECPFTVEVYVSKTWYPEITQIGFTGAWYFK